MSRISLLELVITVVVTGFALAGSMTALATSISEIGKLVPIEAPVCDEADCDWG